MGENLAIVGPNGAGKSTLLNLLFGRLQPSGGTIHIQTVDGAELKPTARRTYMSFMPTYEERIHGLSVFDSVAIGFSAERGLFDSLTPAQETAIQRSLERVELWSVHAKKVDALSAGEYQRVRLARQFALNRTIMLLDEPFSYLDAQHVSKLTHYLKTLSAEEKSVIITSHELNHVARCCDKILVLDGGRQAAFAHTTDVMQSDILRKVFKLNFVSVSHPENGDIQLLFPHEDQV